MRVNLRILYLNEDQLLSRVHEVYRFLSGPEEGSATSRVTRLRS